MRYTERELDLVLNKFWALEIVKFNVDLFNHCIEMTGKDDSDELISIVLQGVSDMSMITEISEKSLFLFEESKRLEISIIDYMEKYSTLITNDREQIYTKRHNVFLEIWPYRFYLSVNAIRIKEKVFNLSHMIVVK